MLKTQAATVILHRPRFSWTTFLPATHSKMTSAEDAVRAPPTRGPSPSQDSAGQPTPPQPPTVFFPMGYREAAYQWWTSVTPAMAERNVLKHIPYIREATESTPNLGASAATDKPDPFGNRIWRRSMVRLSGKDRALNEFSVERVGEDHDQTLVMVHGYGAGLSFFYKNFEPISRVPGLKLYALDMLGMGNSSRPPFKIHAKDRDGKITEAENWFIDALEEWRKARKIERFTLLGHSLGGYLAVSYALKYPGRLQKLILASPAGIPEDPHAVNASLPEPDASTMQNEFTQDQQDQSVSSSSSGPATATSIHRAKADAVNTSTAPRRTLPGWLVWLWDANVSPFSIVRMTGPLGPRFVSGWSSRRFSHLPADEAQNLHDYSFSIFKQKGSGEYALAYLLAPGAYARRPIINRIHQVGRQPIPQPDGAPPKRETGLPVVFMYGENDWMDVAGGLAAEEKLKQAKINALLHGSDDEKRNENGSCRVITVPRAGHHLYLDNPDFFNDAMRREMEELKEDERRRRLASS